MKLIFSENNSKLEIELTEKSILNSAGNMRAFLNAYNDLCCEVANSDIAKNTIGEKVFSGNLLALTIKPYA